MIYDIENETVIYESRLNNHTLEELNDVYPEQHMLQKVRRNKSNVLGVYFNDTLNMWSASRFLNTRAVYIASDKRLSFVEQAAIEFAIKHNLTIYKK